MINFKTVKSVSKRQIDNVTIMLNVKQTNLKNKNLNSKNIKYMVKYIVFKMLNL